jgi:hypothetical protein
LLDTRTTGAFIWVVLRHRNFSLFRSERFTGNNISPFFFVFQYFQRHLVDVKASFGRDFFPSRKIGSIVFI